MFMLKLDAYNVGGPHMLGLGTTIRPTLLSSHSIGDSS